MKKILTIFVSLLFMNYLFCMEICHNYDCMSHSCFKAVNCAGETSYKCGESYCTRNESTCNRYKYLIKKSPIFLVKFETCPPSLSNFDHHSFEVVCFNKGKFLKKYLIGNRIWHTYENVNCSFISEYKFECGSSYCSKDSRTCTKFNENKLNLDLKQIKTCIRD